MSSFQVLNQITDTNGVTHDIQCIHRATMNTTTSTATAFVVNTSSPESVTNLYDGLTIVCKNTKIASAKNCTLNLNGLGAKRIWLSQSNSYCTTHWALNQTYIFIYDEANTRWELQQGRDTDSDNYDRNRYKCAIKCNASTAIVAGNIIVGKDGVFHHLKEGTVFDINYPILYANEAVAVNATTTNTYNVLHITITTTQSISMTAYKPVYIKGTLDGCNFTPVSTTPLTQAIPIQEDNYYYILLGVATAATTLYLNQDHRIFAYKNGKFGEYSNHALKADSLSNTTAIGGTNAPIYIDNTGTPQPCYYEINKAVPADAGFSKKWEGTWQATKNNPAVISVDEMEDIREFYITIRPLNNLLLSMPLTIITQEIISRPYQSLGPMQYRGGYYRTAQQNSYYRLDISHAFITDHWEITFSLAELIVNGTNYLNSGSAYIYVKYRTGYDVTT